MISPIQFHRRFPALLAAFLIFGTAQIFSKSFNLEFTTFQNDKYVVKVSDELEMNLNENALLISSPEIEVSLPVNELKGMRYAPPFNSGISSPRDSSPEVSLSFTPISLKVEVKGDFSARTRLCRIFDSSGASVYEHNIGNSLEIPLSRLGKGVHMLQIDTLPTIKFIVR